MAGFECMAANDTPARGSIIERHVQSVLLTIITAVLLYMGSFVITSREDAVRVTTQLASLTSEIAAVRSQLAAMQANYATREELRDHEHRLRVIEQGKKP